MKNRQRLVVLLITHMLLSSSMVWAIEDFYINTITSPQVYDMFRYGNVNTALYTGKVNVSIPIYELDDPDFDLNIALRYHSEGFKPRKHSGCVGYNWFLEAGGCITREIRNIPDEKLRQYESPKSLGMLAFIQSKTVDKNLIFNLDDQVVKNCGSKSYSLDMTCEFDVDYLPDIFHFSFCGYQGRFMINNQGKAVILEGDFVNIDLSNLLDQSKNSYEPNASSFITIKTTDGYTYIFGGDLSTVEYTYPMMNIENLGSQSPPFVNVWNLKQIIAPNHRIVSFYYKESLPISHFSNDHLWIFNEYYNYFAHKSIGELFPQNHIRFKSSMAYSVTKGCVLDSIVISGSPNVHISFHNSVEPYRLYGYLSHYVKANNNYMLDSIQVETDEQILKTARLTYDYRSFNYAQSQNGYYWRFLDSVNISGMGTYSLEYNHANAYPDLLTPESAYHSEADYYGYWEKNMLQGLLKTITFPTGGKQTFAFEQNVYGVERKLYTYGIQDIRLVSETTNNASGLGVRIRQINTYNSNNVLIEQKTYRYNKKGTNMSSGVYYNHSLIYTEQKVPAGFLIKNNGCYSFIDSPIGYSYVEECTKYASTNEENKIGYTFDNEMDEYNSMTDRTINRKPLSEIQDTSMVSDLDYILSGMFTFDSKINTKGKLLLKEYYVNNRLIQNEQWEYNNVDLNKTELIPQSSSRLGCTDTIVIFSHGNAVPIARKLFICPPVLNQKVTAYFDDGEQLFHQTSYTYDSKFRIKKETTTNSDGMTYFTKYTYPDEFNISYISSLGPNPSPYVLLKKHNQISEPIETISGYMEGYQEKVISGRINLFKVNRSIAPNNRQSVLPGGSMIVDSNPTIIPDSMILQTNLYPVLYKNLDLHITNSINDYQPISVVNDSLRYDSRYCPTCTYEFDSMLRLTSITPVNNVTTSYTWDGIYPISKTTGSQTSTYTYIPYVGMNSMTDARGVTTYYEYDAYGRLIEIYQLNNGRKEILNKYIYHIKSEPQL